MSDRQHMMRIQAAKAPQDLATIQQSRVACQFNGNDPDLQINIIIPGPGGMELPATIPPQDALVANLYRNPENTVEEVPIIFPQLVPGSHRIIAGLSTITNQLVEGVLVIPSIAFHRGDPTKPEASAVYHAYIQVNTP